MASAQPLRAAVAAIAALAIVAAPAAAEAPAPATAQAPLTIRVGQAEDFSRIEFRWAAGAKPHQILERRFMGKRAAHRRKHVAGTRHHHRSASSFLGRLFIQPVIEPAPVPMMAAPGFTYGATAAARSFSPSMVMTLRWPCARSASA